MAMENPLSMQVLIGQSPWSAFQHAMFDYRRVLLRSSSQSLWQLDQLQRPCARRVRKWKTPRWRSGERDGSHGSPLGLEASDMQRCWFWPTKKGRDEIWQPIRMMNLGEFYLSTSLIDAESPSFGFGNCSKWMCESSACFDICFEDW